MSQPDPALERAKKYVTEVRDFFYHLMTFVLIIALLIFIDRRSGPNDVLFGLDWAFWVIFGWGFGVGGHAISVFFGEHRVQQVMEKEQQRLPSH